MLSRIKTTEEARFEFYNLFTSLHSANKGFTDDKIVTPVDFMEYHQIANTQIERDCEFRNFIIGVWNMDLHENLDPKVDTRTYYVDPKIAGKKSIAFPAKNSHEQWKHDFHRSVFGSEPTIIEHSVQSKPEVAKVMVKDSMAGIRNQDFATTKGIQVVSEPTRKAQTVAVNPVQDDSRIMELTQKVVLRLKARGARGIIGLGRSFRVIDDNNSMSLNIDEFAKAMRDYRISDDM